MIAKVLEKLQSNKTLPNDHVEAVMLLERAGIIEFLRLKFRPRLIKGGADIASLASEAAWSAGANDMLEALLNFVDLFYGASPTQTDSVSMGFNALETLKKAGDLMEEEIYAIRTNSRPKYPGSTTSTP